MKDLLIFPYNGNALEAVDCLGDNYRIIGFVDDSKEKQGISPLGFNVYSRDAFQLYRNASILAVPGSPASFMKRSEIIASLNVSLERFISVIHPKAIISSRAKIGINTLIMGGVVLTSNAVVGNHVCILPNSVIHHDSIISDYTLIGSNVTVAGYSKIGKQCYIGSGSSIINNIQIGDNSLIGMGSTIIKDVAPMSKVVGNPGRVL